MDILFFKGMLTVQFKNILISEYFNFKISNNFKIKILQHLNINTDRYGVVIRIFAPCPFRKRKYAIMPPKNVYICVSII